MKNLIPKFLILFIAAVLFTSCEIIGDIFQAGMGVGIFLAIVVVALVIYGIAKISGK